MQKLRDEPSRQHHKDLTQVTLERLILFNRRRQCGAGQLKVESFQKVSKVKMEAAVLATLSPFERRLSENLRRLVIPGKKGRGVPVLIIEEMNEAIQLLLDSKEAVGVQSSEYVFTSASGVALRDYDSLKLLAKTCGAKNPDVLTSTKLRKHVATVSQVLNLRDNELDHLANFLGHDVRVHWDFCRIPDSCTQVTKISKLMATENGIESQRGKNLAELDECGPGTHEDAEEAEERRDEPMDQTDEEVQETHVCGQRAVALVEDGETKQKPAEKREEPARQEVEETPNAKKMDRVKGRRMPQPPQERSGREKCGVARKRMRFGELTGIIFDGVRCLA